MLLIDIKDSTIYDISCYNNDSMSVMLKFLDDEIKKTKCPVKIEKLETIKNDLNSITHEYSNWKRRGFNA